MGGSGDTHNSFSGQAYFVIQGRDFYGNITFAPTITSGVADEVARALALAVHAQWRDEAGLRGLMEPAPIKVAWRAVWGQLADHPQNVGAGVSGNAGELAGFAQAFRALPRRRLVVLGGPGAGKTSLAILLLLELLQTADPEDPVPVLLPVSSWDPQREHLRTWLARRITEEYPQVRIADAARLIAQRKVLPILDGLDEFAPSRAARAMGGLSRALSGGDPIILTCREQEYSDAVHDAGRTIGSTAVIKAEALTTEIVLEHLQRSVPPGAVARWRPLLDHLAAHPSGVAASALNSPLMVSLLRSAYDVPGSDPSELLDTEVFGTAGSIENHLLDAVIPTAFDDGPAYSDPQRPPTRRWSAAKAERWLTFLATTMSTMHTQDLAWWQLPREHTTVERSLGNGLIAALWWSLAVLITGVAGGGRMRTTIGLAVLGSLSLCILMTLSTRPFLPKDHPRRLSSEGATERELEDDKPWKSALIAFVAGVAAWAALIGISLLMGGHVVAAGLNGVSPTPPGEDFVMKVHYTFDLLAGLLFLMLGTFALLWFPLNHHDLAAVPDLSTGRPTKALLTHGRRAAVLTGLGVAAVFAVPFVGAALCFSPTPFNTSVAALTAATLGLVAYSRTSYGGFRRTARQLARTGGLPWRLTAFLEDAHRLGVLRQAGTVYQFRHARLRDRLAERAAGSSR
jgi:hypothetical protein